MRVDPRGVDPEVNLRGWTSRPAPYICAGILCVVLENLPLHTRTLTHVYTREQTHTLTHTLSHTLTHTLTHTHTYLCLCSVNEYISFR